MLPTILFLVIVSKLITAIKVEDDGFRLSSEAEGGFLLEDEELALAHIDMDIRDLEDLEKTISLLREQIRKHSDEHVVDPTQLRIADGLLESVEEMDIHPSLLELKSLKKEIIGMKHKLSSAKLDQVNAIVESAEQYLSSSVGIIHDIEMENVNWNLEEEKKKMQLVFHPNTNFSKPALKKIYVNKSSSEVQYPAKMSEGAKVSLDDVGKVAIKKIKEDKVSRKVPEGLENTNYESRAEDIDVETFLQQLKIKLDEEEEQRKLNKTTNEAISIKTKVSNEIREEFDKIKDKSRQFVNQVFNNSSGNNDQEVRV